MLGNKYCLGKHPSKETVEKLKANCHPQNLGKHILKGNIPWNKGRTQPQTAKEKHPLWGKHHSDITRKKISDATQGRVPWNKGKKGLQISWCKGKKLGPNRKQSERMKGNIYTLGKKYLYKPRPWGRGAIPWNKGRHHSESTKDKLRKNHANILGNNNPNWRGGLSFEPYSLEWTLQLKESVRKRDHYTCQMPGCDKRQENKTFPVHHKDYNKKNCNPNNLITLCHSCHTKTNFNREKWTEYFNELLTKKLHGR